MSKKLKLYNEKKLAETIYCLAKENCQPCVELTVLLEELEIGPSATINALNTAEKMVVNKLDVSMEYNEQGHVKRAIGSSDDDRYTKAFSYINQGREMITSEELYFIHKESLPDTLCTLAINCPDCVERMVMLAGKYQLNVESALKKAEEKLSSNVSSSNLSALSIIRSELKNDLVFF